MYWEAGASISRIIVVFDRPRIVFKRAPEKPRDLPMVSEKVPETCCRMVEGSSAAFGRTRLQWTKVRELVPLDLVAKQFNLQPGLG